MRRVLKGVAVLGALGIVTAVAGPAIAGTDTTTLANGAELSATISSPSAGDTFLIPPPAVDVDVPVIGSASIGEGEPNVHWTYVIDVSGSTGGRCGSTNILACEKQAVKNLNADVVSDGSGLDVGLAVYGSSGASADMSSMGGDQSLIAPNSADFVPVVNSVVIGGVNQFTAKGVGSGSTNFTAGLTSALTSVSASTALAKNVVFLSDGRSNTGGGGFNAAVAALAAQAKIYSFAVGAGASCTGGSDGTLQQMAVASGGTCTPVPDPADLPDIILNVTATEMKSVALTVDAAANAFDTNSNPPPFDGPDSTNLTATAADQVPGAHEVCLTATGTGPKSVPASQDTATVCETYYVYGFGLTPITAVNELSDDDTHTVTATLSGEAGFLAGFPVVFSVSAGPNAATAGVCVPVSCNTDVSGQVTFTYSVPQVPASLGTDTITATVTVNAESATLDVTKEWVDTIAPDAACLESVNPNGRNTPKAPGNGGQGQNQDGFYELSAEDNLWPADSLQMFVTDSGSGTVFGPYAVGDVIKYTEDSAATPEAKPIGGPNSAVEVHIIGTGDALVTAVDGSGNISDPVSCLVPPPPK